jgi:excisionase family DNA binding protein
LNSAEILRGPPLVADLENAATTRRTNERRARSQDRRRSSGENTKAIELEIRAAVRESVRNEVSAMLVEFRSRNDGDARRLLGVEEAARHLGLSTSTVYKRAERCELPSVKDGGRVLFRIADLDAYADARRRSPERVQMLARPAALRGEKK